MAAKLQFLFDVSKFEARKTADQEEFERHHKEDMEVFYELIHKAFKMTKSEGRRKPRHFKNKNYNATVMSGNITGLLLERFPDNVKEGPNERTMFSRQGKYCLYFKKLNNRKMPSNVRTLYTDLVAYQKTIVGGDKMPIIFIGYTTDDNWSQVDGVYAVYIQNNKRVWTTVIEGKGGFDMNSDDPTSIKPMPPIAPVAPRVKRQKKAAM